VYDPTKFSCVGAHAWGHTCGSILTSGFRWCRPLGTTVNKSECSKQALSMGIYTQYCLNDLAWDCLGAVNDAWSIFGWVIVHWRLQ